jgi:hypothetical protein
MNVFLEVTFGLGCADGGEFLDRGLEKLRDVQFDLFAQAGVLQGLPQIGLLNVGKSAIQWTFHNVVVHHCALLVGEVCGGGSAPFPLHYEDGNSCGAVTMIAEVGDWNHIVPFITEAQRTKGYPRLCGDVDSTHFMDTLNTVPSPLAPPAKVTP